MSVHPRRDMLAGLASVAAGLITTQLVSAQTQPAAAPTSPKPAAPPHDHAHMHDAKPVTPAPVLSPEFATALQAIALSTAACQRDGRVCLAKCTEHLAAGMPAMETCQRAVMNMLTVTAAMADVAGYRNADSKNIKALAVACASFCRACAANCEPHKDHHAECKACMESCLACAKACEALPA
jgi:Cys-rich four helix bundle protein (predicted Tat secretion target)